MFNVTKQVGVRNVDRNLFVNSKLLSCVDINCRIKVYMYKSNKISILYVNLIDYQIILNIGIGFENLLFQSPSRCTCTMYIVGELYHTVTKLFFELFPRKYSKRHDYILYNIDICATLLSFQSNYLVVPELNIKTVLWCELTKQNSAQATNHFLSSYWKSLRVLLRCGAGVDTAVIIVTGPN